MAGKPAHNSKKSAPGRPFVKGKSGNPGGRPKNRKSITYWLNEFGNMTPAEVAKECATYAAELNKSKEKLPFFALIALRTLMTLANQPDGGLFGKVLDRVDGKLPTTIRTWKDDVIDLLRSGTVDPADVWEELGTDLATELFVAAGIPLASSREAEAAHQTG